MCFSDAPRRYMKSQDERYNLQMNGRDAGKGTLPYGLPKDLRDKVQHHMSSSRRRQSGSTSPAEKTSTAGDPSTSSSGKLESSSSSSSTGENTLSPMPVGKSGIFYYDEHEELESGEDTQAAFAKREFENTVLVSWF